MRIFHCSSLASALLVLGWSTTTLAVSSAELYTTDAYFYGRVDARIRFAPGSGVVGAFFLWKDGSEVPGTFWNELDFEKVGAECELELNAFYGDPEKVHTQRAAVEEDLCNEYHTYTYEWTPEYVAWLVDDVEVRRDTGETPMAFSENATEGMQIRFNVWPGDASFGGVFDPGILPVHQFIDWVQYSSFEDGSFNLEWREDFDGPNLPDGWTRGSWPSPKNLSTHSPLNVGIVDGHAVLALTDDDELGVEDAKPNGPPAGEASKAEHSDSSSCSLVSPGPTSHWALSLLLSVLGLSYWRRRSQAVLPKAQLGRRDFRP